MCGRLMRLDWKLAWFTRISIFLTHFHKIFWANFPKCWVNFAPLREPCSSPKGEIVLLKTYNLYFVLSTHYKLPVLRIKLDIEFYIYGNGKTWEHNFIVVLTIFVQFFYFLFFQIKLPIWSDSWNTNLCWKYWKQEEYPSWCMHQRRNSFTEDVQFVFCFINPLQTPVLRIKLEIKYMEMEKPGNTVLWLFWPFLCIFSIFYFSKLNCQFDLTVETQIYVEKTENRRGMHLCPLALIMLPVPGYASCS